LVRPKEGVYNTTHAIEEQQNTSLTRSNKATNNRLPNKSIQGYVAKKNTINCRRFAEGGRTFKLLAAERMNQGTSKVWIHLALGQCNYSVMELKESMGHIYCTNSFEDIDADFVTQYKVI
jgi:ribose-phosphate pyrophosphokinase